MEHTVQAHKATEGVGNVPKDFLMAGARFVTHGGNDGGNNLLVELHYTYVVATLYRGY